MGASLKNLSSPGRSSSGEPHENEEGTTGIDGADGGGGVWLGCMKVGWRESV